MPKIVKIANKNDILVGEMRSFSIEGEPILICNINNEFYAMRDVCSHMEFELSTGLLEGETLTCSWHGAKFNAKTGQVLRLPAVEPLQMYETKLEGEDIYVKID
jgi:nitrite reductase/ring-hydroxylating ferredoxin subunit